MTAKNALIWAIGGAMTLLVCTGCWSTPLSTTTELDHGVVWIFPGIEGNEWSMQEAYKGFREAGVERAIHVWDWDRIGGPLANLTDYQGNRARAVVVADELLAYRADHPDAPIDLVGYSGGAGIAIFAAEELPEDFHLRKILLCQPALSPSYDLTAALQRVDETIVNFHSQADLLILGAGTSTFGTMDREYTPSAGLYGFDPNQAVPDATQRSKLVQRAWKLSDGGVLHYGGHFPILSRYWNRFVVGPELLLNACETTSPHP